MKTKPGQYISIFLITLAFSVLLAGCGSKKISRTIFAMDTVMELTIYGDDDTINDCENIIHDIEQKLSVTDKDSDIYLINTQKSTIVSDETASLLAKALDLCKITNGALDISVFPLVKEWGFTTGEYDIPTTERISQLLRYVSYKNISIDENRINVYPQMEIDLGSIAKGYASDALTEHLRTKKIQSALINLGGNVQALGTKPDGSKWKIAIVDPTDTTNLLGAIEIQNKAVITSGGYQRFFEKNGQRYHHIIDPDTGYPADNGLISVTIIGDSGLYCDALSTALFVMGFDKACDFWRSNTSDFDAILVTDDGKVYITEGIEDSFSLIKNTSMKIVREK